MCRRGGGCPILVARSRRRGGGGAGSGGGKVGMGRICGGVCALSRRQGRPARLSLPTVPPGGTWRDRFGLEIRRDGFVLETPDEIWAKTGGNRVSGALGGKWPAGEKKLEKRSLGGSRHDSYISLISDASRSCRLKDCTIGPARRTDFFFSAFSSLFSSMFLFSFYFLFSCCFSFLFCFVFSEKSSQIFEIVLI